MNAVKLHSEKLVYDDGAIREEVIWRVPAPVPPNQHAYKYRLVYIANGVRVIGFDNERWKGYHCHFGRTERAYNFTTLVQLIIDFRHAVEQERAAG
jgi:hypothetical protein